MFKIYNSNVLEVEANCLYPNQIEVNDEESLRQAVSKDYVCAKYKNNYRSNENFMSSNCLPFDCDNDHSNDPNEWITPEDVFNAFKGVEVAIHFSRNHMKDKGTKVARPRFHCFFPIDECSDAIFYSNLKKKVAELFPYFDSKALDSVQVSNKGTTRTNPNLKSYLSMLSVYQGIIKTLNSILDTDISEEDDAFDEFMKKAIEER